MKLETFQENIKKLEDGGADQQAILAYIDFQLEDDLPLFCQVVLPHMFFKPLGKIHYDLFDTILGKDRKVVIAYPRKHGKTTCMKGFLIWCICYHKFNYIVWLGDTISKIEKHMLNIQHELITNSLINSIYGNFEKTASIWNRDEIILSNGFHLMLAGQHYKFRGLLDTLPPDLMMVDDLDDDEKVESKGQRDKLDNWFFNSAITAIDPFIGKIRMVGTCLHPDCQLMRVSNNPAWKSVIHSCFIDDDDKIPLCPELYSAKMLRAVKKELFAATPPKVQTWWQEWMNKPLNKDNQSWSIDHLKKHNLQYDDGILFKYQEFNGERKMTKIPVVTYTAVDIASSRGSKKSDFATVLTAAIDMKGNIYVLDYFRKRNAQPSEVVNAIFEQHSIYNTMEVFMEQVGVQDLIMETYESVEKNMKSTPSLVAIRSRGRTSKEDRVKWAIEAKLKHGMIYIRPNHTDLEDEMSTFPRGANDDLLDPLSDIAKMGTVPGEYDITKKEDSQSHLPSPLRTDNEDVTQFKNRGNGTVFLN